jgi:hypothetical protein
MAVIFSDDFETGDFSTWGGSPAGNIAVNGASAYAGSYGCEADVATGSGNVSSNNSISGGTIRLGCRFNRNDASYASTTTSTILYLEGGIEGLVGGLNLYNDGGTYKIKGYSELDGGGRSEITSAGISAGWNSVELKIVSGNGTGSVQLWLNGINQGSNTSLDNNDHFNDIEYVTLESDNTDVVSGSWYIDNITLRNDDTPVFGSATAFRFLGFTIDDTNLYVSGLKDGATLQLYDYDLAALGENGTASFGGATDAEIDAQARGIFPVARPAADQVLYLYGRDGNNVQVQYNDLNGTLGWTDVGAGTATWGTDKFATGLLLAQTSPNDVIVVFKDDDAYRTLFGTSNWAKMGDATSGTRVAGRDPITKTKVIAGGTVAGTVHYSDNLGVSWDDASGTAMGTINSFEWNL